jgi:hypothetical protein
VKQPEDFDQPEELNEQGESFAELEEYLTHALRRVNVPQGFADRVMARARPTPARAKVLMMPTRLRVWTSGAIAAALLTGVFVGDKVHMRRQRERAEEAQRQFEAGMRITDAALEHTRQQLRRAGVLVGD